jgi:hypothetical protein
MGKHLTTLLQGRLMLVARLLLVLVPPAPLQQ